MFFRFFADTPIAKERVLTGHDNDIIIITLVETDDAQREARRASMGEPYRTPLGHFRHEIGHHYWDPPADARTPFAELRRLFGDETADYSETLERHYANGASSGWSQNYISTYATSHPWEDFAETFAYYLHIVDTVEMASAFGAHARVDGQEADLSIQSGFAPYTAPDAQTIVGNWVPLASMLNNLNRAMGHQDAYPFVLTPQVIGKLNFLHKPVHRQWHLRDH